MNEKEMLKKMKEDFRKLKTEEEREKFVKESGNRLDKMTDEEMERLTDAVEADLKEMKVRVDEILVREKMEAILPMISVSYLAKHYFGKSSSWLYQRINGNKVHGKPAKFTAQELEKLRFALKEISQNIAGIVL
ncbi:DUF5053 domain-containing protein [Butyricimonas paravirosa]|jgi:hypothetical protein|uniref:DUF5053 domain-containing protein n=1 Tax=Butyricimonas paravirosa TaxID=1472417 RepID=UPI002A8244C4|nr:DUF5053 domain-containing protein [Butyricimonas paravirosa]